MRITAEKKYKNLLDPRIYEFKNDVFSFLEIYKSWEFISL